MLAKLAIRVGGQHIETVSPALCHVYFHEQLCLNFSTLPES